MLSTLVIYVYVGTQYCIIYVGTQVLIFRPFIIEVGELERKLAIVVSERDQAVAHVEAAQADLRSLSAI